MTLRPRRNLVLWSQAARSPGRYRAAPATLLAFTAWQAGNGCSPARPLDDGPGYSLAGQVRGALDAGALPALSWVPVTPEEVMDAYGTTEAYRPALCSEPGADAGIDGP